MDIFYSKAESVELRITFGNVKYCNLRRIEETSSEFISK